MKHTKMCDYEGKLFFNICFLKSHVKRRNKIIFICKFCTIRTTVAYSHHYIFIHDLFLSFSENLNFSNRLCYVRTLLYTSSHWDWGWLSLNMCVRVSVCMCLNREKFNFWKNILTSNVSIYVYFNKCPNARLSLHLSLSRLFLSLACAQIRKYANECHYLVPRYLIDFLCVPFLLPPRLDFHSCKCLCVCVFRLLIKRTSTKYLNKYWIFNFDFA